MWSIGCVELLDMIISLSLSFPVSLTGISQPSTLELWFTDTSPGYAASFSVNQTLTYTRCRRHGKHRHKHMLRYTGLVYQKSMLRYTSLVYQKS